MQVFIAEKGSILLVEKLCDTLFHAEKSYWIAVCPSGNVILQKLIATYVVTTGEVILTSIYIAESINQ